LPAVGIVLTTSPFQLIAGIAKMDTILKSV
jgi:hypothetical protein